MMMPGFPKDTTFSPYLVLRNTTEKPLDVSLQLNYMMGMDSSAPVTRNLPPQHLGPFEARQVEIQAALNSAGLKNFNNSINLSTSFSGNGGDLVLASGSVDQTGTYVFEVEPQGVSSSRSKFTNYWGVANGNDTMFSLWNPTTAAQDIAVTLYYGDGSGKYTLPVHLEPQASTMIDMAMLIAEHKPDLDGNIIPSNIQEGSADFASAKGPHESITLVIAAGIYNVSTATCGGGCITCCGDSNFGIGPNPILCPSGETMPCSSTAVDCHGYSVFPSSWSSSNTAVMTVDGSGNVTGVDVGSATITANFLGVPVYTGQLCSGGSCPSANPAPTDPVTVNPPDHLKVLSDTYQSLSSCPTTVRRLIRYQSVDVNNASVGTIQTKEQFGSKSANTCNNGNPRTSETCSTDTHGIFTDQLFIDCNSVGGSCGVTYTHQQWLWCPAGGKPAVVIATPGDDIVHNDSISVGGNTAGFRQEHIFTHRGEPWTRVKCILCIRQAPYCS